MAYRQQNCRKIIVAFDIFSHERKPTQITSHSMYDTNDTKKKRKETRLKNVLKMTRFCLAFCFSV